MLLTLGMNLESIPPGKILQGVPKEDWVAVWFIDMNVKTTISPTAAFTDSGV